MKPSKKEVEAIRIAEQYYIDKKEGSLKIFSHLKFKLKSHPVSKVKTLAQLWHQYGLHSTGLLINEGIKFSDEVKMECIKKWFNILYSVEFDVISDYNYKLKIFNQEMSDYYKLHHDPNIHINWNFPSPEKYIEEMEGLFGNYN